MKLCTSVWGGFNGRLLLKWLIYFRVDFFFFFFFLLSDDLTLFVLGIFCLFPEGSFVGAE